MDVLYRSKLRTLILLLLCLELVIFLWALGTTEPEFVCDKCARNSGRVSSIINLGTLLLIGYYGFGKIYDDEAKKHALRALITMFTVNHVVHLAFVLWNFDHHHMVFSVAENVHGALTFACLLTVPVVIWFINSSKPWWNVLLVIHLFNVGYFIMKTFDSKIKPEHPAYHNQLGIAVTGAALIYVLFRTVREYAFILKAAA
ncbi:MAG: hypothetical protein IPP83_16705 [Flavobacteriales bacterium]|nr:hypothetical protein [Flavobacteriales bacterium]MBL0129043.1 hypothetical protein [Flavobacteriales bacterium]MCC6938410.1 hypothetical protein [Flavobacteriales bacterium]